MNAPTVPPLYEIWHDGGFIVSEANGHQSRDTITLTGGAPVLAGTVLGKINSASETQDDAQSPASPAPAAASVSASVEPGAGNVGNGELALAGDPQPDTPPGTYMVQFTSPARFSLNGPDGVTESGLQTGYEITADGLAFTVTQGDTKFAAGDTVAIDVVAHDFAAGVGGTAGGWCALNPTASDGSQNAAGILFGTRDASGGDVAAVAITRMAEVNATELIWPTTVTQAQIEAATTQLQALAILMR